MKKSLKEKLAGGELTVGTWITLAHPAIAEIMAKSGFDWVAVDLEHSVITIREAEELIRVVDLCGVMPLVRLTSNNPDLIKRVMDAGSHGVIVPFINTAEDAKKAVSAVYYPNRGTRGVGLARAQGYGVSFREYQSWHAKNSVVIVMIEHVKGVENVEAILSTEGVDGYIVGPYDLSGSMGKAGQFDDPQVVAAIKHVHEVGKKLKKPGGIHVIEPNPEELEKRVGEGFTFLAYSLDTRMLDTCCRNAFKNIKK